MKYGLTENTLYELYGDSYSSGRQNGSTCQYENPDSFRKSTKSRPAFPNAPQE